MSETKTRAATKEPKTTAAAAAAPQATTTPPAPEPKTDFLANDYLNYLVQNVCAKGNITIPNNDSMIAVREFLKNEIAKIKS